ncbi:MAG TPA: peptidyl-prolyl cis-trans isomerase [Nitrospirota bacterium]|nr:peptidyl-prolyl cis-trans isomerase [Nitrospirota bacterium]
MQKTLFIATGVLTAILLAAPGGAAAEAAAGPGSAATMEQKPGAPEQGMIMLVRDPRSAKQIRVPVMSTDSADLAVAEVNSDRITVKDLRDAIAGIHEEQDETGKKAAQAPQVDLPKLLKRLIDAQLIYQEAQNIGLDELPEVTNTIDVFRQVTLRNLVREQIWKDVKVSDAEFDKAYRESSREVKTSSAFFEKEKDAKKAAGAIKAGKSFDDVVAKAVKSGAAKGTETGSFTKVRELDPVIIAALDTMKIGAVSPVKKINLRGKPYFVLFRYEAEQFVDTPELKDQVRQSLLGEKRTKSLGDFLASLNKKYVTFNTALIESLDYGPQGPGLEKLLEDQRVVAEIRGDKPVTVADLSDGMQERFFHGMKSLAGPKLIKARRDALESVVQKRLLVLEAKNRGIDQSAEYLDMVRSYTRDIVFGQFVQRVLAPSVKVTEEDLRAYYRDHRKEYLSPPQVKARSLIFSKKPDALSAIETLKKGSDFAWVKANAPGQVAENPDDEPPFPQDYVALNSLAGDVQRALEGAKSEDTRLYAGPGGQFYVLFVEDMVPPREQPFEQVQESIRPTVFYAKLNRAVDEWIGKLRASADIKVYLAGAEK